MIRASIRLRFCLLTITTTTSYLLSYFSTNQYLPWSSRCSLYFHCSIDDKSYRHLPLLNQKCSRRHFHHSHHRHLYLTLAPTLMHRPNYQEARLIKFSSQPISSCFQLWSLRKHCYRLLILCEVPMRPHFILISCHPLEASSWGCLRCPRSLKFQDSSYG